MRQVLSPVDNVHGFISFMLKGKILLDYGNLFYPNEYEKNDKTIQKCFR